MVTKSQYNKIKSSRTQCFANVIISIGKKSLQVMIMLITKNIVSFYLAECHTIWSALFDKHIIKMSHISWLIFLCTAAVSNGFHLVTTWTAFLWLQNIFVPPVTLRLVTWRPIPAPLRNVMPCLPPVPDPSVSSPQNHHSRTTLVPRFLTRTVAALSVLRGNHCPCFTPVLRVGLLTTPSGVPDTGSCCCHV